MDLLQLGRKTSSGNIAVLVAVDSLTKFAMTGLVSKLSAEEIIKSILENIIFKYGISKMLITDRLHALVERNLKDLLTQ
uniref:Integrase catalytic domain-containing protein n=1 Tax=Strongyloides venezuelensis TaxID=75913 RepID=A0A0K0G4I0_STRVS